ncbi:MAG: SBBP repeat-containing protein [Thermoplasmatota archaeon]
MREAIRLFSYGLVLCFISLIFSSSGVSAECPDESAVLFSHSESDTLEPDPFRYFTENLGQWDERVLFRAQTEFGFAYIGSDGIYYDLPGESRLIKITFPDRSYDPPEGVCDLDFPTNYLKGNDTEKWIIGARSYRFVIFEDVWPDIDIKYYFRGSDLKYDVIIGERGNPDRIRFDIEGADDISVEEKCLIIGSGGVEYLRDGGLKAFSDYRSDIPVKFRKTGRSSYGFDIKKGIGERITIDPLVYSTLIGGSSYTLPTDVAKDETNCTYLYGQTFAPDFPNTTGAYDTEYNASDLYITKLNSSGTGLVFSTFLGGWYMDLAKKILVDEDHDVYVCGETYGKDFPSTPGVVQEEYYLGAEIFITKLNSSGDSLLYSTFIGGASGDFIYDMEENDGRIYFVGETDSKDLIGAHGPLGGVHGIAFFSILERGGVALVDSALWDGYENEFPVTLEIDIDGTVVIGGYTSSMDFPITPHSFQYPKTRWRPYGFIIRYDPNGNGTIFSSIVGECYVNDLKLDDNSDIIFCGNTWMVAGTNASFPLVGDGYSKTFTGWRDAYAAKLEGNGSYMEWSTLIGGSENDTAENIHIDKASNVYLYGETNSEDFPTTRGCHNSTFSGVKDTFIVKFNDVGSDLRYSTYLGTETEEWAISSCLDSVNKITVLGYTGSADFPVTPNSFNTSWTGYPGLFLSVLTIQTAPSAPLNLTSFGCDGNILLNWERPEDDGNYRDLSYIVYRSIYPGAPEFYNETGHNLTFIDLNVSYGIPYAYWVRARNPSGYGPLSNLAGNISSTFPDPPKNVRAEVRLRDIEITFEPPDFSGGTEIISYSLYRNGRYIINLTAEQSSIIDGELQLGTRYEYRMTSWNLRGQSSMSDPATVVSKDIPSPPRNLSARACNENIHLRWEEPESFGDVDISQYNIYRGLRSENLSLYFSTGPENMTFIDGQLLKGRDYYYAVSAVNLLGESERSVSAISMRISKPSQPLNIRAKGGNGYIEIDWEQPFDIGGSEIERYMVYHGTDRLDMRLMTAIPGNITFYRHDGLADRDIHYYFVSAVNLMGRSNNSDIVYGRITIPPIPPINIILEPGILSIKISWEIPKDLDPYDFKGFSIYRRNIGEEAVEIASMDPTSSSFTDRDLSRKTVYYYHMRTMGELEYSDPSFEVSGICMSNPDPPTSVIVEPMGAGLSISWDPPDFDGGLNITGYSIFRTDPFGMTGLLRSVNGNVTEYIDNNVLNGPLYSYYLIASNIAGKSEATVNATGKTMKTPDTPGSFRANGVGDSVILTWSWEGEAYPELRFNIYRSDNNGNLEKIATLGELSRTFVDENVHLDHIYRYCITAENDIGESEKSGEVEIQILGTEEISDEKEFSPTLILSGFLILLIFITMILLVANRNKTDEEDFMNWEEE